MLNKNDPLIGAVQQVMQRNQAEREAALAVNEKFGIADRKALPHERQHEWDAAYKKVLTEGVEALKSPTAKTNTAKPVQGPMAPHGMKGSNLSGAMPSTLTTGEGNSKVTRTGQNSSAATPSTYKEETVKEGLKMGDYGHDKEKAKRKEVVQKFAKNIVDTMKKRREKVKEYGVDGERERAEKGERIDEAGSVLPKNLGPGSGQAGQRTVTSPAGNKMSMTDAAADAKGADMINKLKNTYQPVRTAADNVRQGLGPDGEKAKIDPVNKSTVQTPIMDKAVADKAAKDVESRKALASRVQAGRVGDPGKQNFIQNARANKEREKAAGQDGSKYLPVPPKVQQAVRRNQPEPGRPQTLSPGAVGGQQAQPKPQSNPSSFEFTDAERKGKVSAERLKQWRSSQGSGGDKLSLGNFLNAANKKTAAAGGRNDANQAQKTYNIKRSNVGREQ